MVKKFIIVGLIMGFVPAFLWAQEDSFFKDRIKHFSEAADNCYIGLDGGVQALINESNVRSLQEEGKGILTGCGNLSIGKFFNPWNAIQLSILGGQSALYSYYNDESQTYDATESQSYTKIFANFSIDFLYDITHIVGGYNPKRILSYFVYFGPGMTMADVYDVTGDNYANFTPIFNATAGMVASFRLSSSFYFDLDLRAWVTPSLFGKYSENYTEGTLAMMAGFTYVIDGKKAIPYVPKSYAESLVEDANKSIKSYQLALDEANKNLMEARRRDSLSQAALGKTRAEAQAAIDEAMRQMQQQPKESNIVAVTKVDTIIKTVVKEKILMTAGPMAIFFDENMSSIDDRGLVNLQLAADAMKSTPNRKYKLVGYTDINRSDVSVGSNKTLSIKRAKKVYDELVRLGVRSSQLSYTGMGPQENMFGSDELNRVVLIEAVPDKSKK